MSEATPIRRTRRQRFLNSRGVGKFRRNRMAMGALGIIAIYVMLGVWIGAMEVLDWSLRRMSSGQATTLTIRNTPVLGAFLPHRAAERVGPPRLSGFGLKQVPARRADQYSIMLSMFDLAARNVDRLTPDSTATPREILDESAMAERRIADIPMEDLKAAYDEAMELFRGYDQYTRRITAAANVRVKARDAGLVLARLRTAIADGTDADKIDRLKETLVFEIEELGFLLEDERSVAGDETFFPELDPEAYADLAMDLSDAEAIPADLEGRLAPFEALAREGEARLVAPMQAKLDEIGEVVRRIYPMPKGLKGLVYRVRISMGTDRQGRSILVRALYSAKIALQVGAVAAIISVIVGTLVGSAAAFFGSWVDHAVIWVYSTLSSIPYLVLLTLLAFVFQVSDWAVPWDKDTRIASTLIPLYAAFCMTFWIGPCRVIRGETMKLKQLEYVQAATALGFGRYYILLKHVIPNTMHLVFINVSLLLIAAIKSEVVLTFLGLGVKDGASWGIMIQESTSEVIEGFFWQIGAATFFMLVLVLAFNIVSDALQDAFDPKHVG
ncbi:MAG: ABC transporter permease [Phycisphaeraceae bacterium]|nr:ABC transporter permease [Phycisphaeraceae bacterium]MCW5753579.1 ABC transporter permease [Phycisphaeraceae bacterium]